MPSNVCLADYKPKGQVILMRYEEKKCDKFTRSENTALTLNLLNIKNRLGKSGFINSLAVWGK